MAHQFIQFNKNYNPHPLSLERVKVCRCTVSMSFGTGIHLIKPAKTVHVRAKHNTDRGNAPLMVSYSGTMASITKHAYHGLDNQACIPWPR